MALRLESSALLAEVILGTAVEELALMRLQREVAGEIEGGLAQVRWWARHGWMDGSKISSKVSRRPLYSILNHRASPKRSWWRR